MAKKAKAEEASTSEKSAATPTAKNTKVSPAAMRAPIGAFFAEMVGTFVLAAVVIAVSGQQLFVMFALVTIVLMVGHLSGSHVNPAITFGAWVTRQISGIRAIGYMIAQFVGAMLAVLALQALLGGQPDQTNFMGTATPPELFKATPLVEGKEWFAFFAEITGAAIFGFAVAAALKHKEQIAAAFSVGGGLFVGLLIGGATVVLNPAVALAIDALSFSRGWMPFVVYALATFIGAALGFLLYKVIRKEVGQDKATVS